VFIIAVGLPLVSFTRATKGGLKFFKMIPPLKQFEFF
jgi:hypothetical protein